MRRRMRTVPQDRRPHIFLLRGEWKRWRAIKGVEAAARNAAAETFIEQRNESNA